MKYGDVWGAIVQSDSYIHIETSYLASPEPCYSNSVSKLFLWPISLLDFLGNKVYHVYLVSCPVHPRHKSNPGTAMEELQLLVVGSAVGNSSLAPRHTATMEMV